MDAWKLETMHPEWWYAVRLPVNWKLAEEAFMEQYHVIEAHPQLVDQAVPPRTRRRSTRTWLDAEIRYLHTMSEGHGRHGPRQRRAGRRGCETSSCPPSQGR